MRIRGCPAAVSTNPRRRRDDALSLFTGKHPIGAGYGLHQCVFPQFVQPPPVIIQCSIRAHFFDLPQKARCRSSGRRVCPGVSWAQPSFSRNLSRKQHHGQPACNTVRWRTIVPFHKQWRVPWMRSASMRVRLEIFEPKRTRRPTVSPTCSPRVDAMRARPLRARRAFAAPARNLFIFGPERVEQHQRHARGLAGTGRRHQHGGVSDARSASAAPATPASMGSGCENSRNYAGFVALAARPTLS